jgi:N-acetylglucosamine-6-phosphate deacetylase
MLLRNATAYIDGRFHEHMSVRTLKGVLSEASPTLSLQPGEDNLDINGDFLLPGFVDVHTHAFMGMDVMAGEEAVRHMSRELKKFGVAAFLPTTMSASVEDTKTALQGIDAVMKRPERKGSIVLGAHMEAPFLNAHRCGAQVAAHFLPPSMKAWLDMTGDSASAVRIITLAPELSGAESLIRHIASQGIVVSIGHTDATCEQTHQAADWGATHVTHLFNAQTPLNHREPGVPGAALTDDRLYVEIICDGIHLHPDTIRLVVRAKGREKTVLITDAMEAAGMPEGTYQLGGQTVYVKDGAARLSSGTLAGSTLTMAKAFQNLIRFGIKAEDAAYMATRSPADSIGEKLAGRITPGAPAILTRWDKGWNMVSVIG